MDTVKIGEVYRHFKGTTHTILNLALDSETLEKMVVYDHKEDGEVWVRPEKMFLEEIDPTRPDNITGQTHRFELVTDLNINSTKNK